LATDDRAVGDDGAVGTKEPRSASGKATRVSQADVGPDDQVVYWPRPVHDREWVDAEGTSWRIRGGDLDQKQFRRLLKRPDVHVVRAYELYVAEVHDVEREALLARVEEYFRGQAPRYTDFELGDFRDATHRVVLIVQGC
jgi:hypothetical protein